ncbi:MAG: KamA family radical SAM protein [Verrucomicrobia bacterium]|nr:KamA family radical SAM protein [Verrucomicrobiota bacterium]MBS0646557.1 KamA family radical SAM protein [Verrucomicrobiota bacterium]
MHAITSLEVLCTFLNLDLVQRQRLVSLPSFPLLLPMRLAQKIQKGTLEDPILKQFVPLQEETLQSVGYSLNPVGDQEAKQTKCLLKKYQQRALLITTGACAMNCRFCFRRSFDYPGRSDFAKEIALIQTDTSLREIILSGGDPLSLSNKALNRLISQLDQIPHLKRLRFHTRFPLGYPERLDQEFLDILTHTRLQVWFVLHSNHPKELDNEVFSALQRLPCPKLCQTVLLKGVNDHPDILKELCETLVDHGILPYYLHQLDKVEGAHHFEVEESLGKSLIEHLNQNLSGYAVPRYVKEIAGAGHKITI